jgi:hypothetical protein
MIDREKVQELSLLLAKETRGFTGNRQIMEEILIKWFGQNQPEPVVVGLSDEWVYELGDKLVALLADDYRPTVGEFNYTIFQFLKYKTFPQTEVKEVPVGLSDEQVDDLCGDIADNIMEGGAYFNDMAIVIKRWQKTQTLKEPCECGLNVSQIHKEQFKNLQAAYEIIANQKEELEQLKSQKFTPSWDDAPEWANWLAQDYDGMWWYYENKPIKNVGKYGNGGKKSLACNKNWQQTLQHRPKPTPQVKVGQFWIHTKTGQQYIVDEVLTLDGKTKLENWNENLTLVVYNPVSIQGGCKATDVYRRTREDFLKKFERVG